jgi:hypothetical protein
MAMNPSLRDEDDDDDAREWEIPTTEIVVWFPTTDVRFVLHMFLSVLLSCGLFRVSKNVLKTMSITYL